MSLIAPTDPALTAYDEQHAVTYMRILDADAEGADWREVAQIVRESTRIANQIERGRPSRAILRAPNGWHGMGIGTCSGTAGLAGRLQIEKISQSPIAVEMIAIPIIAITNLSSLDMITPGCKISLRPPASGSKSEAENKSAIEWNYER